MLAGSLYGDYIKEREGFDLIETDRSFATYKIRDGECFIGHMYVAPEYRKQGLARSLTEKLLAVAKEKECVALVGTVALDVKGATKTLKAALEIGYGVFQARDNVIVIAIKIKEGE